MKKHLSPILILAFAAVAVVVAGCGKSEDPAKPVSLEHAESTASLTGYVYYVPDLQTSKNVAVPADQLIPSVYCNLPGTSPQGSRGTIDLSPNFTYVNGSGADAGKFTIDIPAPTSNYGTTEVIITFKPVTGVQIQSDGTPVNGSYTTIQNNYSVSAGVHIVLNPIQLYFNASPDIEN